ncbi:transporter substrate-binding domain-containing protein [Wolinella succinogenes]|uniref:BINDING PROTEIN COMPONENT ABC TRANSPORTER n=1 Tax=Wolinella succinogenes (strain ATCC 29543 / DSM 1740 / CCUG 13145 / JCM 31913 / LMG 7466 / NCTC 11488 / FDC 602W) TaxID=273121 RepID=Q7MAG1_WOLSU|nr:transporter substrate-binding domain-containing protein [Wolinella succinogenes]NLU34554.1 transporter substrate-binding domain-containing protein [Wolinella succinogenes]CAE09430.1 BINDING PROTEIN COMPONENT ABC TRANSPORTER [Wolinella succinogenes]VEG81643.1 Sulfate starvation-induced protein 7 [Wolinella succinogenes]HCZ18954.1 amino acid ABC transporter substrate-binding protein [Helicobacter sp.]
MKKILLGILLALGVAWAADMALWEKSTLNAIIKRGELRVSTDPGYYPFEMKDKKGNVIGFDIDIAREMAKAMGVKLVIVQGSFDSLISGLLTDKADLILAGMTITPERNLKVAFSNPYFTIGQTLLVRPDLKEKVKNYKDLDKPEYTVVTKLGVTGEIVARRMMKNAKIKTYDTEAEAVQEVLNGKADAFIYDFPFNSTFMMQKGKGLLVHLDQSITYEPLGIALKKGDPDFLNWLNHFLAQIKHDGTYDELYERWFVDNKWLDRIQ